MGPEDLRVVLAGLPASANKNFIFGSGHGDDAGVYQINPDTAIVQTVDFFTPIVDDPYDYGAIAAANSLSDCYVLGAKPITALSLVCFPKTVGTDVLREILRGGTDKVHEAGAVVVGGHTVEDPEPKFGLAVTGVVDPKKMITNTGAKPGDLIVLTKKIGTGIASNVAKKQSPENPLLDQAVIKEVIDSMKTLNKAASEVMVQCNATASTDITGFGLLGHAHNVALASKVAFKIFYGSVPKFPGIEVLAIDGVGGAGNRNFKWITPHILPAARITERELKVLCDAQTSGPLLFTIPRDLRDNCISKLKAIGIPAGCVIGEVTAGKPGTIEVCEGSFN